MDPSVLGVQRLPVLDSLIGTWTEIPDRRNFRLGTDAAWQSSLVCIAMPSSPSVLMTWTPAVEFSSITRHASDVLWFATNDTVYAYELTGNELKQYWGQFWPSNIMVHHAGKGQRIDQIVIQYLHPDTLYVKDGYYLSDTIHVLYHVFVRQTARDTIEESH
jgi:hypothetical protein